MSEKWIVVTTINKPTAAIEAISALCESGWNAVVVGDRKTPPDWSASRINYLSIEQQRALFPGLADIIPYNHYCRKNLGYLYAILQGAECILETDDDNIPYDEFGYGITRDLSVDMVGGSNWINVYRYFTEDLIWPRGLPLEEIHNVGRMLNKSVQAIFPIQQYLADLDPDVDAIYRMILNKEITFKKRRPVGLEKHSWTPFNSQNTLFFREAFPLLYLPCHVSFRMTDIWRSFLAQQCLWVFNYRVAFLSASVKQVRNPHNLTKDFLDEVPGYVNNTRLVRALSEHAQQLSAGMSMSAVAGELWKAIYSIGLIPNAELEILKAWQSALDSALLAKT